MHSQSMAEPGNTSHSCGLPSYAEMRVSHSQALIVLSVDDQIIPLGTMATEHLLWRQEFHA